jgi:hypothetical protein
MKRQKVNKPKSYSLDRFEQVERSKIDFEERFLYKICHAGPVCASALALTTDAAAAAACWRCYSPPSAK